MSKNGYTIIRDNNGEVVAIIFNISDFITGPDDTKVFTPNEWGIQIGFSKHSKGYSVRPHIHIRENTEKHIGSEALIVLKGRIKISLYDKQGNPITNVILSQNTGIVFRCGHAVDFLDDAVLLEIKEGPYPGKERDKIWICQS